MTDPRAFVSFDFDNNEKHKNLFVGQAKSDFPTLFTVHDWSSKTALSQAEREEKIKQKMASTNMCIVLVRRSMSTATGVTKEITMVMDLDVPVFGVYVNGARISSTLRWGCGATAPSPGAGRPPRLRSSR
jgi:hypothetical protein